MEAVSAKLDEALPSIDTSTISSASPTSSPSSSDLVKPTIALKQDADSGQITVLQAPVPDGVRKEPIADSKPLIEKMAKKQEPESLQLSTLKGNAVLEKPIENTVLRSQPKVIDALTKEIPIVTEP